MMKKIGAVIVIAVAVGALFWMYQGGGDKTSGSESVIQTESGQQEASASGTVSSNNCAQNLQKLRAAGALEMKSRRDAAIASGVAASKAEADYQAELKVADAQFELLSAQCVNK